MVGRSRRNLGYISCCVCLALGFVMIVVTVDAVNLKREHSNSSAVSSPVDLFVGLTVVQDAVTKGAVCLDGSPPAYNLHRGFGSGSNSWLIHMEGGGWCHNITSCSKRAHSRLGSSIYMGGKLAFSGILSDNKSQNPDFYNWNRVKIRYCDGASFTGDVEEVNEEILESTFRITLYDPPSHPDDGPWSVIQNIDSKIFYTIYKLYYRGQRIWQAVMADLLMKGMHKAKQALLSGCSAGGLTSFLHCDHFRELLPKSAKVKCLGDAGFFLDTQDISGAYFIRSYFNEIVTLQGSVKNLPRYCTSTVDPSQCFFPQYLLPYIETPVFVLNAAYDSWQIKNILAPSEADPFHLWQLCKLDINNCDPFQLAILEGYRLEMLGALFLTENSTSRGYRNETISALNFAENSTTRGMFINSCYAHCQTEMQDLWHSPNSPRLNSKTIAVSVADWFFDRLIVKAIDCPYPCDSTCHNRVFTEEEE